MVKSKLVKRRSTQYLNQDQMIQNWCMGLPEQSQVAIQQETSTKRRFASMKDKYPDVSTTTLRIGVAIL